MELFVKIVNGFSCVEDLSDSQNILPDFSRHTTVEEAYSEPSQRYKMKLLVKIVNSFQLLAFFAKKLNFRVSFLNRDSFHARRNSHYMAWSNKNNKKEKMKSIWESYLEWTKNNKCLLTLDLKPFRSKVKGSHSACSIPEPSCEWKETVGEEIITTSTNMTKKSCKLLELRPRRHRT